MSPTKECRVCGVDKSLDAFHRNKLRKDGRNTWCVLCVKDYHAGRKDRSASLNAANYATNKDKVRAQQLARNFGLTPKQYDEMLRVQGGVCAVCGKPPTPARRLAVDHDHKTGLIRGLLCYRCNRFVIGRNDADIARRALTYFESPPAIPAIGEVWGPKGSVKKRRKKKTTSKDRS